MCWVSDAIAPTPPNLSDMEDCNRPLNANDFRPPSPDDLLAELGQKSSVSKRGVSHHAHSAQRRSLKAPASESDRRGRVLPPPSPLKHASSTIMNTTLPTDRAPTRAQELTLSLPGRAGTSSSSGCRLEISCPQTLRCCSSRCRSCTTPSRRSPTSSRSSARGAWRARRASPRRQMARPAPDSGCTRVETTNDTCRATRRA